MVPNLQPANLDRDDFRGPTELGSQLLKNLVISLGDSGIADDLAFSQALSQGTVKVIPDDAAGCSEVEPVLAVAGVLVGHNVAEEIDVQIRIVYDMTDWPGLQLCQSFYS